MTVSVVIPAAGLSKRMRGGDKLMEDIDGCSLLARQVEIAFTLTSDVVVVLPPAPHPRHDAVSDTTAKTVISDDPNLGMGKSLSLGVAAIAQHASGVLVHLPDMPEISSDDLHALKNAFDPAQPDQIVQATSANGTPGHPVLFGTAHIAELLKLAGDKGAKDIVQRAKNRKRVPLSGERALLDLDTPEDWLQWRQLKQS